eukprot:XP_011679271.1 PREDICTED: sestrin homolog [Strongylocentrotus purpuratus]
MEGTEAETEPVNWEICNESYKFQNMVREIFTDVFVQSQRLDHLTAVMGLHPQYLAAFCRTQDFMLRGNGPLPYDYRNYIAILVSA